MDPVKSFLPLPESAVVVTLPIAVKVLNEKHL
jgi:hypothetical protein